MQINFRLTAACLALIATAFIAGCGGGGGGGGGPVAPSDTTAPVIRSASIPTSYPYSYNRTFLITAVVTDNIAVTKVTATITPVSGGSTTLTLSGNGTYTGQYTAPANTGSHALTYNITIIAKDAAGNTTDYSGLSFQIAGTDSPPIIPQF